MRLPRSDLILALAAVLLSAAGAASAQDVPEAPPIPRLPPMDMPPPAPPADDRDGMDEAEEMEEEPARPETVRAAVFVRDRCDEVPDEKVDVLNALIVARATDAGFRLISRDDVINAVADLADAGANKGLDRRDPEAAGVVLDEMLSDQTSAVRLAQTLGADYVLMATMATYGEDRREFKNDTISTTVVEYRLRTTFALLDVVSGESLTSDVVDAVIKKRATGNLAQASDVIDDLIDQTAELLGDELIERKRDDRIPAPSRVADAGAVYISCSIADLTIPEIVRNEAGEYVVTANRYAPQPLAVTVEIDGVAIGTTENLAGKLDVTPGLHVLRLTREGFEPYERRVNLKAGSEFEVALRMTPEFERATREKAEWFTALKANTRLTDAQVEVLRGRAQSLRQSGIKYDVKIDTDQAPTLIEDATFED